MSGQDPGQYPGQYPAQPPYQGAYGRQPYPEQSQATAVFILGLLAMFVFPILAPVAWIMGNQELRAIDAGRRPPDNRGLARVGQVFGIIMSLLMILFIVLLVVIISMLVFARA